MIAAESSYLLRYEVHLLQLLYNLATPLASVLVTVTPAGEGIIIAFCNMTQEPGPLAT